jgi:hypothetical protein
MRGNRDSREGRPTLPFVALAAALALGSVARAASPFSPEILQDRLWDDGKAEYDVYDALEAREGVARPAHVVHVIVKEPFNMKLRVKADRPPSTDVIKMNQVVDVPAGAYAYHQMHSSFWARATGALVKFSMSSHDTCGNTFEEGWIDAGSWRLVFHTYWDGEGDGERVEPLPPGGLFLDELPFRLRTLARWDPAQYTIPLFPSVIDSKLGSPAFMPATIRVLPAGGDGTLRVEVTRPGGVDRFAFRKAAPHVLIRWERPDGSRLELKKSQRLDYWNHHAPGDEKILD